MYNPKAATIAALQSEHDFYCEWLAQCLDPTERQQLRAECIRLEARMTLVQIGGSFHA